MRLMIIGDVLASCEKMLAALNEQFECLIKPLGSDALQEVNDFQPDILLLNITTSTSDSFSICQTLTSMEKEKKPLVVFISEANDIETKMKAYDAGGYDFIASPFSAEELIKKLQRIGALIKEGEDLKHTMKDTQSLALTSMKQASHYGYIMNFFKNLFRSSSINEVAKLFFEAMNYWELNASLLIRLDDFHYFDGANIHSVSPIERKIFVTLSNAGRLYEFGHRMIVNDKHCSFLIKNMPDDTDFAGEVRDIVAVVIEGLEAKVVDLKRQSGLELVTTELTNTIQKVKQGVMDHNQLISSVMTDMIGAVSSSFHSLDLTEFQEQFFHELFEQSGKKIMSVEDVLLNIQEQLYLLSNQVDAIIEDTKDIKRAPSNTTTEVQLF